MNEIWVQTDAKEYPIYIESNFELLWKLIEEKGYIRQKICIITDDTVEGIYGIELKKTLSNLGAKVSLYSFPAGEHSKNISTLQKIYDYMIEIALDRSSVLIALGGGVVGDMTGFAAATYMRGIPFIQIPTSLLAQVDSSVGGKTGIDYCGRKNIIGAFYQPDFVYINTTTMVSLDPRQFYAGMAEVIKHGLIQDELYYQYILDQASEILSLDPKALAYIIQGSCKIKSKVVSQDEKEKGLREILNFGHTIGHAVESLSHFEYLHGECVALGMVGAAYLSFLRGFINENDIKKLEEILLTYNLPIRIKGLSDSKIYEELFYDKKVKNKQIKMVLLENTGNAVPMDQLKKEEILEAIRYVLES